MSAKPQGLTDTVIEKLFGKRALADLTDEVITLLQHIASKNTNTQSKRELDASEFQSIGDKIAGIVGKLFGNSKRALADLTDDEVIALLQHIASKNIQSKCDLTSLNDLD
ncbi:hypothetical protein MVEN_02361700 [Mycena venus]|uniref:Uncharacterized protein n=1 Tax=Mycena venus TaxID=2733690 RepID=A0A8H6X3E2_9AGAR|nr:hypothetical protein MVEN_02361700 [Mycena venus]